MSNEPISIVDLVSGEWQMNELVRERYNEFFHSIREAKGQLTIREILEQYSRNALEPIQSIIVYPHRTYEPIALEEGSLLMILANERTEKINTYDLVNGPMKPTGKFEREIARCFYTTPIHAPTFTENITGKKFFGGDSFCGAIPTGRYRYRPHKL